MNIKSCWTSSMAGALLLGSLISLGQPAFAVQYDQWRAIQHDRIDAARDRGYIKPEERERMSVRVDHVDKEHFADWHEDYWHHHPDAWRYEENSGWSNGHYAGYPYPNDTLGDIRDILSRF